MHRTEGSRSAGWHRPAAGRNVGACILAATVVLLLPVDLGRAAAPEVAEAAGAQENPPDERSPIAADLEEQVEVRILQLEVTAWPKSGDVDECRDLTRDDFEVRIGGQPRNVLAVDRLGALGKPVISGSEESGTSPAAATSVSAGAAMRYIVVFDTWHLDLLEGICGRTVPLAFSWVREMLENRFQPGDRVMLATLSNQPRIYTPWLDNREAALQALKEMEVDPRFIPAHREHGHDHAWLAAWKLLLESLGQVPGRKHLLYLGDDWDPARSPGTVLALPAVGARAQKNHVLIDPIDTLAACRIHPELVRLGLGTPNIIANLAVHSGGHLFGGGQTAAKAVATLRQMQSCRFLVSVAAHASDRRKHGLRMRAVLRRRGFRLAAPERAEDPRRGATEEEKRQALFLLPRWEQGLFARADLWPVRPTGKKNRWDALLIARLRKTDTARWPEDIEEIMVDAVVYRRSRVFGEYRGTLRDEQLAAFIDSPTGRSFTFPVTVPSGAITVAITVKATGAAVGATSRTEYVVPQPPGAGEAHPWFLVDRVIRIGDRLSLAPSTKSSFLAPHPPMLLGFGCPPESAGRAPGRGKLVRQDGQGDRQVDIRWFDLGDPQDTDPAACRWLIGEIEPPLDPGLWDFHAPSFGGDVLDTPALTLRMRAPADAK